MQELNTSTEFSHTEEEISLSKSKKILVSVVITILTAITIFVVVFRVFFGSFIVVSGPSMEPTFYSTDLIGCLYVKEDTDIQKGDIVVFKYNDELLIKRVSSVAGDNVPANDKMPTGRILKDNEYYVVGDNSDNSLDSRSFGPITREDIKYIFKGFHIRSPWKYVIVFVAVLLVVYKIYKEQKLKVFQQNSGYFK